MVEFFGLYINVFKDYLYEEEERDDQVSDAELVVGSVGSKRDALYELTSAYDTAKKRFVFKRGLEYVGTVEISQDETALIDLKPAALVKAQDDGAYYEAQRIEHQRHEDFMAALMREQREEENRWR